jgi:ribosomal protein L7/L12
MSLYAETRLCEASRATKGECMVTETEVQQLRSRVNELEDRIKFLYRRLNIDYADPNSAPVLSPQIQEALRRGNKIEAIKIYRELTGVGLAEAKDVIDKAERFTR